MRFGWLRVSVALSLVVACGDDDGDVDSGMTGSDSAMADTSMDDAANPPPDTGSDTGMPDAGEDAGPTDSGDLCSTRATCDEEGLTCQDDTLVRCGVDEDGCLVETTEDCANVTGGFCDSTDTAACMIDPCRGLTLCDRESRTCNEVELVVCEMNMNGCIVETRTDCTGMGGACSDAIGEAACVMDPCAGVTDCTDEGAARCEGNTLQVCEKNAFGCLVEMATDCAASSGTCGDDAGTTRCIGSVDCDALPNACENEATRCEGPELVACARDAFNCLVETRNDCTDTTNGFCDGSVPQCAVAPTDPCEGVAECTTIGRECIGNELVVCSLDSRGCQVETRATCGAGCERGDVPQCAPDFCPPASDTATVLSCETTRVVGSMRNGTNVIDQYECTTFPYERNETVWRFETDTSADGIHVTVSAERTSTDDDLDLYALDGLDGMTTCGLSTPCLDSSTAGAGVATETVDFDYHDGDTVYIALDQFGGTNSAQYELRVNCRAIECGNGFIEEGEECDDGATDNGDGCSLDCQIESSGLCFGEPSVCSNSCGDGTLDAAESCDDDNNDNGDDCSANCALEVPTASGTTVNANGTIEATDSTIASTGFQCAGAGIVDVPYDFIRIENTSGVDREVILEASIADTEAEGYLGVFNGDTNLLTPLEDCLNSRPLLPGQTGEIIVTIPAGEQMVVVVGAGDETAVGAWNFAMRIVDCGDGEIDGSENCDDMSAATPGCDASCQVEPGYACTGEPSVCTFICGDGTIDRGSESCDDMNTDDEDGCDSVCQLEPGYDCTGEPSVCVLTCGDGVLNESEYCDDMNTSGTDGCSSNCTVEAGYRCSGVPSTCTQPMCGNGTEESGEACDDMNAMSDDGCDACRAEIAAAGDSITLTGALEPSDPTFTRASQTCGADGRANVFFDDFPIVNNTGTTQLLQITAAWTGGDGYLHVYGAGFDYQDETTGCLAGDDDFNGVEASQITMLPIEAGQTLVVVASTFREFAGIDSYSIEILTQ